MPLSQGAAGIDTGSGRTNAMERVPHERRCTELLHTHSSALVTKGDYYAAHD